MAAIDGELENKSFITKSMTKIEYTKNEKAKSNNNKTPISNRKIVPSISTKVPEIAWNIKNDCDLVNKINNVDISFKNEMTEVENHSLYTSKSNLSLLSCKHDTLHKDTIQQDSSGTCKYIPIPDTDSEEYKFNRKYRHLKSSDSIIPPDSNDNTDGIMNNVKRKMKKYKIYYIHKYLPYFIILASLIEIGVYVWRDDNIIGIMMYSPYERHQIWRFISYMLLHSEWIHLSLNVTIQTMLAVFLELEQGWWRCAIIYLGGGISGAIGTSVLQPSLYMVGASAGVYALLISHIANVIVRFSSIKYRNFRLFAVFLLAGFDVTYTIYHSVNNFNSGPKIGWSAHCAGAIAGITLGLIIYKGQDKSNVYVKIATVVISAVFLLYIIGAIVYNVFYVVIS